MRALIFDPSLWRNDKDTPPFMTWKAATVIRLRQVVGANGETELVVDVVFDHRPSQVSHSHFFEHIKYLDEPCNSLVEG